MFMSEPQKLQIDNSSLEKSSPEALLSGKFSTLVETFSGTSYRSNRMVVSGFNMEKM